MVLKINDQIIVDTVENGRNREKKIRLYWRKVESSFVPYLHTDHTDGK